MAEFTIKLDGAADVLSVLNRSPDIVNKHIRKALQKAGLLVESEAKRNVAQASRALFRSITSRVEGTGAQQHALVNVGEPYGWFVEYGRKPGKMPPHGPGSSLALWAKTVGIISSGSNPTRQEQGILFVIARGIGRYGTRPQPFLETAFDGSRERIAGYFRDAVVEAIKEIESAGAK